MIYKTLKSAALVGGLATSVQMYQKLGDNQRPGNYLNFFKPRDYLNLIFIQSRDYFKFLQAREAQEADVVVIGGGVVGLACARECAVRGKSVIVVEKEGCVAAGATSGNSGIGCTGYDAPRGSLESRLLRRSIQRHQNLYRFIMQQYKHIISSILEFLCFLQF